MDGTPDHRQWFYVAAPPPSRPTIKIDPEIEPFIRPALALIDDCAPSLSDEIYDNVLQINADPGIPAEWSAYTWTDERIVAFRPSYFRSSTVWGVATALLHEAHHIAYPKLKERDVHRYTLKLFDLCPGAPAYLREWVAKLASQ